MVVKKRINSKNLYLILSVAILSIVGTFTVFGSVASATEVYPTNINLQNVLENTDNNGFKNILTKFLSYIKQGIKENNSTNNKYTFNINKDTNNILNSIKNQFSDIKFHPDKTYINKLASNKIISSKNEKFYPDNFVRLHEISKILVNTYRFKVGYDLDTSIGLSDKNYFDKVLPKYYNTAYEMGILNGIKNIEEYERFISHIELNLMLSNLKKQYPNIINLDNLKEDSRKVKRGEATKIISESMILNNKDTYKFSDIYNDPNKEYIEILYNMNVLNTNKQKFYPSKIISRKDFIVLLTKSYLAYHNKELEVSNIEFNIKDLDYNSENAPYVIYAQENGFIDYLIKIDRNDIYINPDDNISKHEIYYILGKVTNNYINHDIGQADKEYMTKSELSKLLVNIFDFQNIANTQIDSQLENFIENIKLLTKNKDIIKLISSDKI